jgi:hypothetical protein
LAVFVSPDRRDRFGSAEVEPVDLGDVRLLEVASLDVLLDVDAREVLWLDGGRAAAPDKPNERTRARSITNVAPISRATSSSTAKIGWPETVSRRVVHTHYDDGHWRVEHRGSR